MGRLLIALLYRCKSVVSAILIATKGEFKMNKYMKIPDVTLYAGVRVDKKTKLKFESVDGKLKQKQQYF